MRTRQMTLGLALAVVLTGACSGGDSGSGDEATTEADGPKSARMSLELEGVDGQVPFDSPAELSVPGGDIESVEVAPEGGEPVEGQVGDDGSSWQSEASLEPGGEYAVTVVAADRYGQEHTLTESLAVAGVPDGERLTLSLQPGDGSVVGVGAPVTVRFDQEVTDKQAVEENMHVKSSPQVQGSWHWLSSTEAHFRPKQYWPSGTKVRLDLDLNGVQAGEDLWGGRSYDLGFEVGRSQVAKIDADNHTMSMEVDGEVAQTWKTSLGTPEFATRNGTYIVLEKFDQRRMTSCNANIACDDSDPEYYDLDVDNAVRLSWSGTFVHSADWSEGSQGSENVSHGCINLSAANGATYFNMVQYGDIVTVKDSTREADGLVERGDPGMADWNIDWPEYVAGSATGEPITTNPL